MTRIAWYTAIVLFTLMALVILWEFSFAIVMLLISIATAAAFRPGVDYFMERGLSKGLSLGLTYLSVLLLIGFLLFAASGAVLQDFQRLGDDLITTYEGIKTGWPLSGTMFQRSLADQLPAVEDFTEAFSGEQGGAILQGILGGAMSFFEFLSRLGIILILSVYWSADRLHFERIWLSLVRGERRSQAREIWRAIESGVGAYIRSEVVQSVLAGVLLWLGYTAMGIKYPGLLAVLGALAWLIPWLGAVLAILPPLLVGWGVSPGFGIVAAGYTLLILMILEFFVEPRFFSRKQYSSLLTVLVIVPMGMASGLIGVILAPPLAAALQIFFRHYLELPQRSNHAGSLPEFADVKAHLASLRCETTEKPESLSPEFKNLRDRLHTLLDKTETYLNSQ